MNSSILFILYLFSSFLSNSQQCLSISIQVIFPFFPSGKYISNILLSLNNLAKNIWEYKIKFNNLYETWLKFLTTLLFLFK